MRFFCQLQRAFGQLLSVSALVLLLAVTASAYTLVLRSGRRIEIPSRFVVTSTMLTYETHPGIQITLQMRAIDIPATERANNEVPGSLMKRAELVPTPAEVAEETGQAVAVAGRTITNRDLEATARRRRDSEMAYSRRVKELGLPSLEESRKRAAAESQVIGQALDQRRVSVQDSENYWRERASALRTEMAAVDAEIGFIRARIDEYPFPNWNGALPSFSTEVPLDYYGNSNYGRPFPGYRTNRTSVYSAPSGPQVSGQVGAGARRGQYPYSRRQRRYSRNQAGVGIWGYPNVIYPNEPVFGSNVPAYDYSYERSALITRFNELGATRAGLNARWRELEEEARRAGAPPGWLRP